MATEPDQPQSGTASQILAYLVLGGLIVFAYKACSSEPPSGGSKPRASASITYTPAELQQMVSAGRYPAQGQVTTRSEPRSFAACRQQARSMVSAVGGNYPTETVVDTAILYMVKLWTNDAAMTISCSEPDAKIVITTAPYL